MRCIKPNSSQSSDFFDTNLVQSQLDSSGSIAYQKLMKIGFPSHMSITNLFDMFKSKPEFSECINLNQKQQFCNLLLRSCGLKVNNFKFGNTQIFFRKGKLDVLTEKLKDDPHVIKTRLDKTKVLLSKWRLAIIISRFCAIGKKRRIENNKTNARTTDARNAVNEIEVPRKKTKTSDNTISSTIHSEAKQGEPLRRIVVSNISTTENLAENQLRNLLRKEREKNLSLSSDYRELQRKNLELVKSVKSMKKEIDRLTEENQVLRNTAKTYFQETISCEHNYN